MDEITVLDMAQRLGISSAAVAKRLSRKGIKPLRYIGPAGLYKPEDLNAIKDGGIRGRPWPKKEPPAAASETAPKPRQAQRQPKVPESNPKSKKKG